MEGGPSKGNNRSLNNNPERNRGWGKGESIWGKTQQKHWREKGLSFRGGEVYLWPRHKLKKKGKQGKDLRRGGVQNYTTCAACECKRARKVKDFMGRLEGGGGGKSYKKGVRMGEDESEGNCRRGKALEV